MIYQSVIFAAVTALSYSVNDKGADTHGAPVPCADKSCDDYCVKLIGGPLFNVTGACAKFDNGTTYCSCNRRTYCTADVCSRSCYTHHAAKPKLRAECEKYLCRCIWEDHATGSKHSRLRQRSLAAKSMKQKNESGAPKKKRPKCEEVDCVMYCQRKYYHQRPLTGRCDGLDCVCAWSIGYSMHKHPLPPYF